MALFDRRHIKPRRGGVFSVDLPEHERDLLVSLAAQLRSLIDDDGDDPSLIRLFPAAYHDDPERDAEYRRLMRDDLSEQHRWALTTLGETAHEKTLTLEHLNGWMAAINHIRLVLGTRLDVSEHMDPPDPTDPEAQPLAVYHYLSWLLEQVVEAMHTTLDHP